MPVDPHRLPRTVIPSRYELTLEPDLTSATFDGSCTAEVEVVERTDEIVLNAVDLEITEAWVEPPGTSTPRIAVEVRHDPETERAHLLLSEPVDRGGWFVHTTFRGELNDKLHGFYRSTYADDDGRNHTLATTQFEATHARRAFPCWDEPELKASFGVTLIIADGLDAVCNTRELQRSTTDDGRTRIQFADSMVMSTYLVAFVVGELESTPPRDVRGVPVRVVHRPGRGYLATYALDVAEHALGFFEDYYDIAYPGDKLDLVAIPDFAFGAMENMGCVTFREVLLLVDPDDVTKGELQRVVDVINHELAHMWFGNLVTMRWWNGIWLNEAFATFMEMACTDAFRPDWERWVDFGLSRTAAFDVDALNSTRPIEYEVVSPDDAEGMFDILTYEKGAAVVRMLEQYLGAGPFRDGIRRYLGQHQYANTETTDLWDALEAATGEPARSIMDSWIFQAGFPLLTVAPEAGGGHRIGQERCSYLGTDQAALWSIPLHVRTSDGQERRLLMTGPEVALDGQGVPHVNAGGHGFYRVTYAPELLEQLGRRLADLSPADRYGLLDDQWAAVLAGRGAVPEFLDLADHFADERDLSVWQRLTGCLRSVDRLLDEPAVRSSFAEGVRPLGGRAWDHLGTSPRSGDDDRNRELRGLLLELLAVVGGDPRAVSVAAETWDRLTAGLDIDPPLVAAAIAVRAHVGGREEYDDFVARFEGATTPQDELRYLSALADFRDDGLVGETMELTLTDRVRTQNAPYLVRRALTNDVCGDVAWSFVTSNWDRINDRFPSNSIVRMLEGIRALDRPEQAGTVRAFFETHTVPQGALTLAQHLERLEVNVALRAREVPRLTAALGPS